MVKIQFDVGHPAHVHLFKFVAKKLLQRGDDVIWSVIEREMILDLLDNLQMPYEVTFRRNSSKLKLWQEIPIRTWQTLRIARKHQSDLLISIANPTVGLPAFLLGKPYIAMTDTEPAYNQLATAKPFAQRILTPTSFFKDIGSKQYRYNGTHELAYLHPDYYIPDASIYERLNLPAETTYSVVRFVAWNATHDTFETGMSDTMKNAVLKRLLEYGPVILSTEDNTAINIDGVITNYPQESMQDILAFASMYVGEGNTMAAEASALGTPAIRTNTMDMGYCRYLQSLGLMFQITEGEAILSKIDELLSGDMSQHQIKDAHQHLLVENDSTTDIILTHIDEVTKGKVLHDR